MKTEEGLAGDREREIENKEQNESDDRREARDQYDGNNCAGRAEKMEKRVAGIEPAERRQKQWRVSAELLMSGWEKLRDRQDAVLAD